MTHLETALRLDPRSPRRHNTLGDIGVALIHAGRYDEAIPLLRQLLQMDPEAAAIGWMLVFALAATGRTSEAGEVAHEIDAKVIPYILRMTRDTANRELLRSTLAQVLDADI